MTTANEKAVTKKEQAPPPAVFQRKTQSTDQIDQKDILIPKILLMQGLSELVTSEQATMGDMVNSVTSKVLGGKSKPIQFIPMITNKSWIVLDKETQKFKGAVPFGPANANWKWEDVDPKDGKTVKNMQSLNFYCFLEADLADPAALPYMLSFRSTSYTAGKKLITHFAQANMIGIVPWAQVFELSCKKEQNDKGTYYVFDVKPTKSTDPVHAPKLEQWAEVLSKGAHQVDESDLKEAEKEVGGVASPSTSSKPFDEKTAQF